MMLDDKEKKIASQALCTIFDSVRSYVDDGVMKFPPPNITSDLLK